MNAGIKENNYIVGFIECYMRLFATVFLLLIAGLVYGQEKKYYHNKFEILDTIVQKNYYPTGELHSKGLVLVLRDTVNVEFGGWQTYYKNGHVKDSLYLQNYRPIGRYRMNYPSGKRKAILFIEHQAIPTLDSLKGSVIYYRKDGSIKIKGFTEGGGEAKTFYNREGKAIRYLDIHKKRTIKVSQPFREHRHISDKNLLAAHKNQKAVLTNGRKNQKLKTGKLLNLKLKNRTQLLWHCQVEGFSEDKILLTKFSYDNGPQKSRTLKPDSVFAVPFTEIEALYIPEINRPDVPMAAYVAGFTFLWEPPVLGLILGFGPNPTYLLVFPAIGIPLVVYAKWRFRKTVPVEYPLPAWQLKPVQ